MGRFDGRRALVTGAAGHGIGQAVAGRLASEGASVLVTDSHPARTSAVAASLRERFGDRISEAVLDVTDDAAVQRVVAEAGPIDVLVNNAGIGLMAPFVELDEHAWDTVLAVNLRGPVALARAVAPSMARLKNPIVEYPSPPLAEAL